MEESEMKRILAIALTIAMIATLLVGCGSQPAPATTSPSESASATPAPSESATPEPTPAGPETFSGEFTWWSFFDQTPWIKDQFEAKYKNVKINLEVIGGDDYKTKLMTTIQSGQGLPDVMDLEEGYIYQFIDSDVFADLSWAKEYTKDYYPWAVALGTDSKGTFKALCDNVSPVCFWYLKDAAEKWLGTSDPDQVANMLSDWNKILTVAKDVKAKSNGEVTLLDNYNEMIKVAGYSITPFVRNGKFAIDQQWMDLIKVIRDFEAAKVTTNLGSWSGEWATAWNEGKLLIRVMPSWDFFTDWKVNTGNVHLAKPFKNSYEGGTYRAVYAKTEKMDLAKEFIKFLADPEYQKANLDANNQVPASKAVFAKYGADFKNDKFGDQNVFKAYDDICNNVEPIIPDKYTRDFQNNFGKQVREGIPAGLTDEQIIDNFKKAMKDKYPEVEGL
jgi:multiple sugar transport system substrate-binding protein